jgi:formyl-CoA transferase
VLDITKVWSGPMASCMLADLGCDVIKIEMPGNREGQVPPHIPGTSLSWLRQTINRNKRSVSLDLRVPEARMVLLRLVATVDVVVENYLPGTLHRWGVGYEQCRDVKPDLVFVSISGWGQYGPRAGRPGYDPIAQAATGWMSLNGVPGGQPVKAPTFLADDLAGLHGTIAALAALRHRERTGEGQHVDVSLVDVLMFQSAGFPTLAATGVPLRRWGDEAESVVPANSYQCRDGRVYIAVALNKQWRLLAGLIGRPELGRAPGFATNDERVANRDAVNAVVAQWCAQRSAADVVSALDSSGVTAATVRSFAEAVADPHIQERGALQQAQLADGTTAPLVGPAAKFSRTPISVRRGAPAPGADTDDVLAALGIEESARARLREIGAI